MAGWLDKYPDGGEVEDPTYYGGMLPEVEISPTKRDADRYALLQQAEKAYQEEKEFERKRLSFLKHIPYYGETTNANTCVSATCELEKMTGRKGMPDGLASNKQFFENYEDYGYKEIDPENVKAGDIIQYYDDKKPYGYHMGVMGKDSMYYSSPGTLGLPWNDVRYNLQNAYYDEDSIPKDNFHAYKYVGFKQGGVIPKSTETTYNNWLDKL